MKLQETNTHSVAWGGIIIAAIGCFGGPVAHLLHAPAEVVDAFNNFGRYIGAIGTAAAYVGRPQFIR